MEYNFGKKIVLIAKEKFGSQKKMAEVLGMSKSTISDWVSGRKKPSFEVLRDLCIKADISLDWLVLDKDDDQKINPFEFARIAIAVNKWAVDNKIEVSDSLVVGIYTTFEKNRKDYPELSIVDFLNDCGEIFKNIKFYD